MNVYQRADEAMKEMNRRNLADFDRLKIIREETSIIKTVHEVYEKSRKRARRRYYEIGYEAYVLALQLCNINGNRAYEMAERAIDMEWVDLMLTETDFITLYRFNPEAERKAARLIEALSAAVNPAEEVEKALRLWTRQIGQFCLNAVDRAMVDAYEDAGVEEAMWNTAADENVCRECDGLDGQIFPIHELPTKPHPKCRCWWSPVFR